ncbi:hypothetical protein QBC40DRAFT_292103 [Triangularia verruculosa]|uniref:Anaphase-promoting complex subunit CDC26 n=1 Tax=Triangularia verruculosa TaxID=2587418 RepID=A0AAN7B1U7_9PEZI|nr:hypothetical protein QBC40DRAFT_292103 [Triangularia verruculosa]
MLRRPLTTLTITPEDIADYEDRQADKARLQARFIARRDREERRSLNPPSHSHPQSRRRTIASSSPSPPPPSLPHQPQRSSSPVEEEEVSYYARAQHQARQVSLSLQAQQTPLQGQGQGGDGQGDEDEDVVMMTAPTLPPTTRSQARMGMGTMGGEMETPSGVRGPVRRSARERGGEREGEQLQLGTTVAGRLRAAGRGRQNGMEVVTPEMRPAGRSREERIGVGQGGGGGGGGGMMLPPAAPRRGRRGE